MFMPTFSRAGLGDRIDAGALPSSGPAMPSRRRRPWLAAPAVLVAAVLAPAAGAPADGP